MDKLIQIAIDGPVASGKGTTAKILAGRLGILYVDTGAMYRVAALLAKWNDVALENEQALAELVDRADLQLRPPAGDEQDGRICTVLLNGEDVSWEIRSEEISKIVALVAQHAAVRKVLVKKQQELAKKQSVVMEGRDIALRVLPQAEVKIYLTAEVKVRAQRRVDELLHRGQEATLEEMMVEIQKRDKRDMERAVDPLQIVPGAWVLDNSAMTILQTVGVIERRVKELWKK